MPEAITTTITI